MDFSSIDEQSPLDFWPTADGLDNDDAATIASLATQALQSKFSFEYGDGLEVNGQTLVANYTESRSSPQSQYSTTLPTEPAESFRGLMEDHERGAHILGEDALSEYDLEPATRDHEHMPNDDIAGMEEESSVPPLEHHVTEPFHPLLDVAADVQVTDQNSRSYEVQMNATLSASRVVNEALSSAYAARSSEGGANLQGLQPQTLQSTPPQAESPSNNLEEPDVAEQEEESVSKADEPRDDPEPEQPTLEEVTSDAGAQQQLLTEFTEQPTRDDGDEAPLPQQTPRGRGRPRKSDTAAAPSASAAKQSQTAEVAVRAKDSLVSDDAAEPVAADVASLSKDEETPAAKKRGRPRKSEVLEQTPVSAKRGPGRPPKLTAVESTPSTGKRGRPPKSDVKDATQASSKKLESPAVDAPTATPAAKRGRPRKSVAVDSTQPLADTTQQSAAEAASATPASNKRGRPRKSAVADSTQALVDEPQPPAVEAETTAPASGKRGRPPKSSVPAVTAATPGKRGRPPKNVAQALDTEVEASLIENQSTMDISISTATKSTGKRGRPPRAADAPEKQAASPSTTPAKKRGRGRPPKNEALVAANLPDTTVEPDSAVDIQEAEPEESEPKDTADVVKDATADETAAPEPMLEDTGVVTPARKRGRPKGTAADKPQPVVDASATPVKKRGRPPKATATEDTAKKRGRPSQSDAQEVEEPMVKRRRTSNDSPMEDAPDEPQAAPLEDLSATVQGQEMASAANDTAHKQSAPTTDASRSSRSTIEKRDATPDKTRPFSRSGGRKSDSGEMPSAGTKQAKLSMVEQPMSMIELLSSGKGMGKRPAAQKTYGKRSRRS